MFHTKRRRAGFDDGHDNDGFTAALLELPYLALVATREAASNLSVTAEEPMKGHAEWLLTFCEGPERTAKFV